MIWKSEELKMMICGSGIACQCGHAKCGSECKVIGFVDAGGFNKWDFWVGMKFFCSTVWTGSEVHPSSQAPSMAHSWPSKAMTQCPQQIKLRTTTETSLPKH